MRYTAATPALYAGLLEIPVAAIENYIRYQKGVVSGEQAVMCGGIGQAANRASAGRGLPPWTLGSAHHLAARRRTA